MEILAMDMKLRGMYIARQLSFHGVTFKIEEVPLSDIFKKAYDDSVELVSSIELWSFYFWIRFYEKIWTPYMHVQIDFKGKKSHI